VTADGSLKAKADDGDGVTVGAGTCTGEAAAGTGTGWLPNLLGAAESATDEPNGEAALPQLSLPTCPTWGFPKLVAAPRPVLFPPDVDVDADADADANVSWAGLAPRLKLNAGNVGAAEKPVKTSFEGEALACTLNPLNPSAGDEADDAGDPDTDLLD
jgi:hypothetical protein